MTHYGTLRDFRFTENEGAVDDIRGSKIYGLDDEKIGKIDDVIFDHSTGKIQYVVIDTGGWLSSNKFVVPPERLRTSPEHDDDFAIDLTKEQIQTLPPYDENAVNSGEQWGRYEERYKSAWKNDPILHREGSDRNLTPTATEFPAEPGSIGSQISPELNQQLSERIIPAGHDEAKINSNATGVGDRYSTFETRLRERHKDITGTCLDCDDDTASDVGTPAALDRKAS